MPRILVEPKHTLEACPEVFVPRVSSKYGIHGHAGNHGSVGPSPTYITWQRMLSRCSNPNNPKYYLYGMQGVRVCERWQVFVSFLGDMGERPVGRTIDRIDPYGDYELGNCRWATLKEQRANRRDSR